MPINRQTTDVFFALLIIRDTDVDVNVDIPDTYYFEQ